MDRLFESERPALSVTVTVKFDVPEPVGVPLIVPVPLSVSPAGSDPPVADHAFPPDPAVAERVCE
jgi:hypothetical protein